MKYLLDSNVISEIWKPQPNAAVMAFLEEADWFIPSPVLAELQEGASSAPGEARRLILNQAIDTLISDFRDTLIDFDSESARTWGRLKHSREVKRQPQALWDSLIDAIAVRHGHEVATRNEKDFRHAKIFNPWQS